MRIDLDKIEAAAKAAQERSPGPWRCVHLGSKGFQTAEPGQTADYIYDSGPKPDGWDEYCGDSWVGNRVVETDGGYYEPKGATAEHIANCSPDAVLEMLAVVRAACRLVQDYRSDSPDGGAATYALCQAVDRILTK